MVEKNKPQDKAMGVRDGGGGEVPRAFVVTVPLRFHLQ